MTSVFILQGKFHIDIRKEKKSTVDPSQMQLTSCSSFDDVRKTLRPRNAFQLWFYPIYFSFSMNLVRKSKNEMNKIEKEAEKEAVDELFQHNLT